MSLGVLGDSAARKMARPLGAAAAADAKVVPAADSHHADSHHADTRSRTEVRSPTHTRTEVRSPTKTATWANTRGNFTATVTGGAGAGATSVTINVPASGLLAGADATPIMVTGLVAAAALVGMYLWFGK